MNVLSAIVAVFSAMSILATVASLIKWRNDWWIRVFDFPRLQVSTLIILLLIAGFILYSFAHLWQIILCVLLLFSLIIQARKIFRYTPFARKQVLRYNGEDEDHTISILVNNVLQTNRKSEKLVQLAKKYQPDLILTLETNKWWEKQLEKLEEDWPNTLKKPLDNLYGMHLFSRFEFRKSKIKNLVKKDIPSFELQIILKSGDLVNVYCMHPEPPFPSESDTSLYRDAELLIVGEKSGKIE